MNPHEAHYRSRKIGTLVAILRQLQGDTVSDVVLIRELAARPEMWTDLVTIANARLEPGEPRFHKPSEETKADVIRELCRSGGIRRIRRAQTKPACPAAKEPKR